MNGDNNKGLRLVASLLSRWGLLGIGLASALISGAFLHHFSVIPLDQVEPGRVGQVLLALIFFALVIERATQVYVNTRIEPERQRLGEESARQRALLRVAVARLARARADPNTTEADLRNFEAARDKADTALTEAVDTGTPAQLDLKAMTRTQTSGLAFVFGVFIAIVGVRTFGPFVGDDLFSACSEAVSGALDILDKAKLQDLEATIKALDTNAASFKSYILQASEFCTQRAWQQRLFTGLDVLITGALLAGGADGLHQIVKRFTRFAQREEA